MDETIRRDNQLVVAGAFFRALVAENAVGLDLGLARSLLSVMAAAGQAPEVIQYSCAFDGSERSSGRFLFGWVPEQLDVHAGPVDPERTYRSLLGECEFPGADGVDSICRLLEAPAVRSVWIGFDARVPPERSRTRLAVGLSPGREGRGVVEALLTELEAPVDASRSAEVVSEVSIEHGLDGLVDVRFSVGVAPATVASHPTVAADPLALALGEGATAVRLVRSLRAPRQARLVFQYGTADAGEAAHAALARRSGLAAELRREVRRASRNLPDAGLTVRACGTTLALENGRPVPDRFAVLFRPAPKDE